MSNSEEKLYYTYLDESKRNYFSVQAHSLFNINLNFYSISSITFESEYYKNEFESSWNVFREKYNIPHNECMHFVEYKKLIDPDGRNDSNIAYKNFFVEESFSEDLLKNFFVDLKTILDEAEFYIIHTDKYWESQKFLAKRRRIDDLTLTNLKSNIATAVLHTVPYQCMRTHLDSLMKILLKRKISDEYYIDEELPKSVYTKLRFDADGKNFDARNDLKKAYNDTIVVGSDSVNSKTVVKLLDEIRFIRKEEVGSSNVPNHCGLEIVDFMCSILAGETRSDELKKIQLIPEASEDFQAGKFANLAFSDGTTINFYETFYGKLKFHSIDKIHLGS